MIPTNPGFSAVIQKGLTKAPYLEATSNWGERFWTSRARKTESIPQADGSRFPKTYFKASVVGYVAAMLVTLVVMNIYQHAQPALLYLVPGVLISLWGTAAVRDEWKLMWEYTEDGSLEEDYIPERDSKDVSMTGSDAEQKKLLNTRKEGSGELTTTSGAEKSGAANTDVESKADTLIESGQKKSNDVVVAKVIENEHAHHVFLFSLSSPKETLGLPKASKLLGTV